jgi:hypothetical protein
MLILLVEEKPAAEFYIADPESDDERIPPTSTQSKKRQENQPARLRNMWIFSSFFLHEISNYRNLIKKFS